MPSYKICNRCQRSPCICKSTNSNNNLHNFPLCEDPPMPRRQYSNSSQGKPFADGLPVEDDEDCSCKEDIKEESPSDTSLENVCTGPCKDLAELLIAFKEVSHTTLKSKKSQESAKFKRDQSTTTDSGLKMALLSPFKHDQRNSDSTKTCCMRTVESEQHNLSIEESTKIQRNSNSNKRIDSKMILGSKQKLNFSSNSIKNEAENCCELSECKSNKRDSLADNSIPQKCCSNTNCSKNILIRQQQKYLDQSKGIDDQVYCCKDQETRMRPPSSHRQSLENRASSSVAIKSGKMEPTITSVNENTETICESESCPSNINCPCILPPAFRQYVCAGKISGNCECSKK